MIPAQVFCRVLKVSTESGKMGTGFLVDYSGGRALLTARHLCNGEREEAMLLKQAWGETFEKDALLDRLGDIDCASDVAAFDVPPSLWPDWYVGDVKLTSQGLVYSQDCYLLGYPSGLRSSVDGSEVELPLIKKGIIAGHGGESDRPGWIVDTSTVGGFSGGPLVFERRTGSGDFAIAGVVNGSYKLDTESIRDRGAPLGVVDAGFSLCADISSALDLLDPH